MAMFPADNLDVDAMLADLDRAGFIERYEVDNNKYIQIVNFLKHQNPHHKEQASTIPEPNLGKCKHQPRQVSAVLDPLTFNLELDKKQQSPQAAPGVVREIRSKAGARSEFFRYAAEHDAAEEAADFEVILKKKKAANSDRAWKQRLSTLQAIAQKGHSPKTVIAKSADSGWTGLFEPGDPNERRKHNGNGSVQNPVRETPYERNQRKFREAEERLRATVAERTGTH